MGIAQGVAGASAQSSTAANNIERAKINKELNDQQAQREYLVEQQAAAREKYGADQERARAASLMIAQGAGMQGSTIGGRVSEQNRQGALSIRNAEDRRQGAAANYVAETRANQIETQNYVTSQRISPFNTILNVASSGLQGYQQFRPLAPQGKAAGGVRVPVR